MIMSVILNAMRKSLLSMLLFCPAMVVAQQTPAIIATFPVTLHQQLSASCELIEPGTLIQYKQYDGLALPDTTGEIYAPELHKGDFVALSPDTPKHVRKSARKSGFDVRAASLDASGSTGRSMTKGSSCPDLQQFIADANNQRSKRRVDLQRRLRSMGSDILPPVPIAKTQPESVANQPVQESSGKPKVREGTAILAMVVDVEGEVRDVHIVRSLDVVLDQKAIEAVRQWRFAPARMNGLPVPVQIDIAIDFHPH